MPFTSLVDNQGFPADLKSGKPRHAEVHTELVSLRNAMNEPDAFRKVAMSVTWKMLYTPERHANGIRHVRNSPEDAAGLAAASDLTVPALEDALAMLHATTTVLPSELVEGECDDAPPGAAKRIAAFVAFYNTFAQSIVKQKVVAKLEFGSDSEDDLDTQQDGQGDCEPMEPMEFVPAGTRPLRSSDADLGMDEADDVDYRPPVQHPPEGHAQAQVQQAQGSGPGVAAACGGGGGGGRAGAGAQAHQDQVGVRVRGLVGGRASGDAECVDGPASGDAADHCGSGKEGQAGQDQDAAKDQHWATQQVHASRSQGQGRRRHR